MLPQHQHQHQRQHTFGPAGGGAFLDEGRPQPSAEEAVPSGDWYSQVDSPTTCDGDPTFSQLPGAQTQNCSSLVDFCTASCSYRPNFGSSMHAWASPTVRCLIVVNATAA